ncbi:hypothetical protein B0H66DRAFT_537554 [Apodospora peruviana]|uniref:Uncharacterized protein n=1 Tax=Apodospora peruviana TaxID=516989 RepID=A0AAE0HXE6_9PEZI|nr:hypothetical protein B0H66DRAFT_537554 [Apodospora peruviana]
MSCARDWKVHIAVVFALVLAASLAWQTTTTTMGSSAAKPYKAPLTPEGTDPKKDLVEPISYLVYLAPGHTLEKLSEAIGRDITPYVRNVVDFDYYVENNQVVFVAERVDDKLLDDIRSDTGVEQVQYNGKWRLDDILQSQDGDGPQ